MRGLGRGLRSRGGPAIELTGGTVFCQACGAPNPDDNEFCARCHQRLIVLSGGPGVPAEAADEEGGEQFSFDEHLLERISILEEAVKRTAEMMRQVLDTLRRQERNILVNQTGLSSLRELLEHRRVLAREEWSDLWKDRMEEELLALERRDRFVAARDRMAALYRGGRRDAFLQHLADAEYAFYALESQRALDALEAAYRLDRDNPELTAFLGETYFNEGDAGRALPLFARLLEARPDHFEALVYGGVIHHERGESERALELLGRAVERYPDAFLPRFALGGVHADRGALDEAIAQLEEAVALDPVSQALYLLGSAYYERDQPLLAARHLAEAVRRDPAFEEAHNLLGLAYLRRGWNRKALEVFRRAQRLNPRKMRYRDVVRYLSGQGGSPLPAVEGEAGEWLARAEERRRSQDLRGALRCYRRALEVDPENPTLLMSYALVCLDLGRTQEIESVSRRVLELEPGEMLRATACAALIEALRSEGRLSEGNRIGHELLDRGSSPFSRTIAYCELAWNHAADEDAGAAPAEALETALDYARRSLESAPDELLQFPLAVLGWVHYRRQEYEEAIDFLSKSSELAPSATTLTHLGMALLAAGQDGRAREVLARARALAGREEALGARMMEVMKDSARLLQRVRG